MTAPIVPKGDMGIGMKNGSVAGTSYRLACRKWPISWAIRIPITAAVNSRPLARQARRNSDLFISGSISASAAPAHVVLIQVAMNRPTASRGRVLSRGLNRGSRRPLLGTPAIGLTSTVSSSSEAEK